MNEYVLVLTTSLWLGILTSISPCPLATNIAAVSFISRKVGHPRSILFTGFLYTLGRMLAYFAISALLVKSILAAPSISDFLQTYMNKILGPLLILVGMILLDFITINLSARGMSQKNQKRFEKMGLWGALPLGIIFALSFCPVSAALFFGSLLPLATKSHSIFAIPFTYGLGTALPVLVFAFLLAFGTHWVARAFHKITKIEVWVRRTTGLVFILVGIYLSLIYIFM